ncbi:MAG: hypothetical protein JW809_02360 [Pirellulales bacterium]|nr:hypothetical protein [Pirellulales bacterium]
MMKSKAVACPAAIRGLCCAACAAVVLLGVVGCGSREVASQENVDQIKQIRRQQQAKEAEEHKKDLAEKQKIKQQKDAAAERQRQEQLARQTQRAAPRRPSRPDDVRLWRKRDFRDARAQADPRLVQAVGFLGRDFVGKANAARLLGEILSPQLPGGGSMSTSRAASAYVRPGADAATDAIVLALIENDTTLAHGALEAVVTASTDGGSQSVAQRVLQRFAEAPDPRTEPLLVRALTQSYAAQPSATGRADARDRQQARLAETALAHGASESFREALAKYVVEAGTPLTLRSLYGGLLEEPRAENLPAQIVLYQSANYPEVSRVGLESQWAAYGSEAVRRTLGCPADVPNVQRPTRGGSSGRRAVAAQAAVADPLIVARVAKHLWSEPATAAIETRLYRAASLRQSASTVLLAGTIPKDSTRRRLHDALSRNWQDGPQPLRDAGLADTIACEPGVWLVLKSCRFAQAKNEGAKRSPSVGRPDKKDAAPSDPWHAAAGELLLATCRRLEKAAEQRRFLLAGGQASSTAAVPADFPLELHEQARLVGELHVAWPDDVADATSAGAPDHTRLWYAQFHETAVLDRVTAHYRRQMTSPRVHTGPQGVWLECLEPATDSRLVRSIDVVIQTTPSALAEPADGRQRLSIDVLTVEIRAPAG